MIKKVLSTKQIKTLKFSEFPITDISYNPNTSIMCASTHDGCLVLSALDTETENCSQVLTPLESISKVKWRNNYEFIVVGNARFLHHFSIMNLKDVSFELHSGYITALELEKDIAYTGSSDGRLVVWDLKNKGVENEITHKIKGKGQPIKDIKIFGNYLYSTTLFKGRMWAWDLRNFKKPINMIETENCQNSIVLSKENLFSVCDQGILKTSLDLSKSEYFYKEPDTDLFPKSKIQYSDSFDSFFWNKRKKIQSKGDNYEISIEAPFLEGFELIDYNRILIYNNLGEVYVKNFFEKFDWCD